jgi:hypothetical protein
LAEAQELAGFHRQAADDLAEQFADLEARALPVEITLGQDVFRGRFIPNEITATEAEPSEAPPAQAAEESPVVDDFFIQPDGPVCGRSLRALTSALDYGQSGLNVVYLCYDEAAATQAFEYLANMAAWRGEQQISPEDRRVATLGGQVLVRSLQDDPTGLSARYVFVEKLDALGSAADLQPWRDWVDLMRRVAC